MAFPARNKQGIVISMSIKQQLDQDLKAAMLAKDVQKVSALKGLKSVILNTEIATGKRDQGLSDDEIITLFQKEAKKRQESADLYAKAGASERAEAELVEKAITEVYLPEQLTEDEILAEVKKAIETTGAREPKDMGKVIGAVKASLGAQADGAVIARLAKQELSGDSA